MNPCKRKACLKIQSQCQQGLPPKMAVVSRPQHAHPTPLINPPDTDDPAAWRFGPSYGSDMIIVAARGISLV